MHSTHHLESIDDLAFRFGWDAECRNAVARILGSRDTAEAPTVDSGHRFQDLGPIARGGMGEVRRVRDARLDREVALKTVLPELAAHEGILARIREEARITARLQHPGVLCVIDAGVLPDGRFWYAMPLVTGHTLTAEIARLHGPPDGAGGPDADPQSRLHQLVSHFLRICEVMAYAHDRRVIHRDLKPANVMVGRFGEIFVMDWGLAKSLDEGEGALVLGPIGPSSHALGTGGSGLTTYGQAMGTPAYMPPEQAEGALERIDERSDVYSLGAVLHELLTGRPPFPPGLHVDMPPVRPDAALVEICEHAMADARDARPADAGVLSRSVKAWLDGARRRAAAQARVDAAQALSRAAASRRTRASALRSEGTSTLQRLPPTASEAEKSGGWRLEDAAVALERQARVDAVGVEQELRLALTLDSDHVVARRLLVELYRDRLLAAEAARDADAAAEAEALMLANDPGVYAEWLRGDGRLTLSTRPSGAAVYQSAWVERDRRLVPEGRRLMGHTPLFGVPIARGSHLLEVEHPGFQPMCLPVWVDRMGEVEWRRPGSIDPLELPLVPEGAWGADDVYVPAGPFWFQGDPLAAEPLPRRSVWVDGFVVRRHPVTVAEVLEWLNDLVANGRGADAELFAPNLPPLAVGSASVVPIPRGPRGERVLPGALNYVERWPVVQLDWYAAMAYADWLAARTGRPWRLLHEVEREKAARGTDGRLFPWGEFPEPTWCRNAGADAAGPLPGSVDAASRDVSPYGVCGLAGNVRDWCLNPWAADGGVDATGVVTITRPALEDSTYRAVRGGSWTASIQLSRAAERFVGWPGERYPSTGFRLACSFPSGIGRPDPVP